MGLSKGQHGVPVLKLNYIVNILVVMGDTNGCTGLLCVFLRIACESTVTSIEKMSFKILTFY